MKGKFKDLTGQQFGKWTVIKRAENDKHGGAQWLCKCDCGNEKIIRANCLVQGHSQSCGCLRSEKSKENIKIAVGCRFKDLTGQQFGRWTVIKRVKSYITPSGESRIVWLCKCQCGTIKAVKADSLLNGSKSCGCLRKEYMSTFNKNRTPSHFKDLTGQQFGRWTVIKRAENDKQGHVRWLCKCQCGKKKIVMKNSLLRGTSRSCGCLQRELAKKKSKNKPSFFTSRQNFSMRLGGLCISFKNPFYKRPDKPKIEVNNEDIVEI